MRFHSDLRLAVKYLFLTNDGLEEPPELVIEPFNVNNELNDYEVRVLHCYTPSL